MNILHTNFKDIVSVIKENPKYKLGVDEDFLFKALPILSSVSLERVNGLISAEKTLSKLYNTPEVVTPNGKTSGENIFWLVQLLYRTNRSTYIKAQNRSPLLGALTPLFMYAHKLHNGVVYEEWDKQDKLIDKLLGKYLAPIIGLKNPIGEFNAFELRKKLMTDRGGTQKSITAAKMSSYTHSVEQRYPKVAMQILLQTWIANVSIRRPNVMILDLENWDFVPEALDAGVSDNPLYNWDDLSTIDSIDKAEKNSKLPSWN